MHRSIKRKWRPSLALVIGGTLAAVLLAPMVGLVLVKLLSGYMRFRYAALLVAGGVILMTLVLGWLLWRLIVRPVRALVVRSEAMKHGHITNPLPHYGTRELRDLGQAVQDMGMVLHNRQATIRTYTDHVTHELKSPLTAIRGGCELLEADRGLSPVQRRELLASIRVASDRMERLLGGMREMAAAREPLGAGQSTLNEVVGAIRAGCPLLDVQMEGGDIALPIPPEGLEIILGQMLANAAAHGADHVQLQALSAPAALLICDNGEGISEGNRARIFEPFFTSRREIGGTGMGLAIVRNLLQVRGGRIELLDSTKGAAFGIWFQEPPPRT